MGLAPDAQMDGETVKNTTSGLDRTRLGARKDVSGSQVAKKPVLSEYAEQKAVIDWWAIFCKTRGLDERLLFAIPNGTHLAGNSQARAIKMNMLKRQGLRVGCPDLMLAVRNYSLFWGLFIEMKRIGGKAEEHQIDYCDLLRRQGYNVVIAQGSEEAIRAIKAYVG